MLYLPDSRWESTAMIEIYYVAILVSIVFRIDFRIMKNIILYP